MAFVDGLFCRLSGELVAIFGIVTSNKGSWTGFFAGAGEGDSVLGAAGTGEGDLSLGFGGWTGWLGFGCIIDLPAAALASFYCVNSLL